MRRVLLIGNPGGDSALAGALSARLRLPGHPRRRAGPGPDRVAIDATEFRARDGASFIGKLDFGTRFADLAASVSPAA